MEQDSGNIRHFAGYQDKEMVLRDTVWQAVVAVAPEIEFQKCIH